MEMHLLSDQDQVVTLGYITLPFAKGESIWTESSYKYEPKGVVRLLERAGFRRLEQWIDRDDGFALTLVEAI